MTTPTLLDIALSNPNVEGDADGDFNILGAALGLFPDLVAAAGNPDAGLTVFAPTDQAFLNLANALDPTVGTDEAQAVATIRGASALLSPEGDPDAFLKTILTYHIVGEPLDGAAVIAANHIQTLSGAIIRPDGLTLRDKDPDFANPEVSNPAGAENGIAAENGILHVIDNVLLPVDITISDGGFVHTGRGADAVVGSNGFDFIKLGSGNDIANGLDGHDVIFGGRGKDLIKGGDGNDKLFGGKGKDQLEGGAHNDYLNGGRGKDHLDGGSGHDKLVGGKGNDGLDGGTGNDHLFGGRGHDTLEGAEGNDYLKGGKGGDYFVFNPFREHEGHDTVADFNPHNDKLILDVSDGPIDILKAIAAVGDPGLQFTDLLNFDLDPTTDGIQAPVTLGASDDGDLLITHPTGTIELDGIPSDTNPADLLPAIDFILPDEPLIG